MTVNAPPFYIIGKCPYYIKKLSSPEAILISSLAKQLKSGP